MPDSPIQGVMLTREDVRLELRTFAAESLQAEFQTFSARLRLDLKADMQDMLLELRQSMDTAPLSSRTKKEPTSPKRLIRSNTGQESWSIHVEKPPEPPITTELPGAVAMEGTACLVEAGALGVTEVAEEDEKAPSQVLTRMSTSTSIDDSSNGVINGNPLRVPSHDTAAAIKSRSSRGSAGTRIAKSTKGARAPHDRLVKPRQEESIFRRRLFWFVNHNYFDYTVVGLILLNGVMVGIQTDYMARNDLEDAPIGFQVVEYLFCVVFTVELGLRLTAFQTRFFTMPQRSWNIFDFVIVTLQLVEIFMSIVAAGVGFSFNILRILRLVRVVRVARALRLIGELRTIVSSIAGSIKPLFWTGVLLFLIAYVIGVALTQLVHAKRLTMMSKGEHIPAALDMYWGSLIPAIFTLIQSITGGIDWDDVCRPLMDKIGVEVGILFTCYILFSSLAMLNVVTGVFIDSVMENGRQEKENRTMEKVQTLFATLDVNHEGEITWEEFNSQLEKKEMKDFFKIVEVDISLADSLFALLDLDESGSVDATEFMDGCLRIWSPAKGLDLRMLSREIVSLKNRVNNAIDVLERQEPSLPGSPKNREVSRHNTS